MTSIDDLLLRQRIIVCCGSGGIGKTTLSATLAVRAAQLGRRALVVTIDPAKRLATALGCQLGAKGPTDLTPRLTSLGVTGHLAAFMPDTARTFEDLIHSLAGGELGLAQRVFRSSFFQTLTQEFSGAQEYMAMEILHRLVHNPEARLEADLIILDTPPARQTTQFLEAPELLRPLFDDENARWLEGALHRPTSWIGSMLSSGVKQIVELIERLTGRGFITELYEFTQALFALRQQFLRNLKEVDALFQHDDVSFVLVCSPSQAKWTDIREFLALMSRRKLPFWGYILNRSFCASLGWSGESAEAELNNLKQTLDSTAVRDDEASALRSQMLAWATPKLSAEVALARSLQTLNKEIDAPKPLIWIPENYACSQTLETLYENALLFGKNPTPPSVSTSTR